MTRLCANGAGNDWATAANWDTITNTPTLHAMVSVTIGTSYSATFTAPNTTNYVTGVWFLQGISNPVSETYTITLQENSIDTTCSVSAPAASWGDDVVYFNKWVYFRFPIPYKFTATTAGLYRFKITRAGSSTSLRLVTDSGGSLMAFMATDDRHAAPTSADDVYIGISGSNRIVINHAGTNSVGSGTDTSGLNTRTIGSAITIAQGGTLQFDTAASTSLTVKGNVVCYGASYSKGIITGGSASIPYPASQTLALKFDENSVTTSAGLEIYKYGSVILRGTPKSVGNYVSGVGTAASPFIVSESTNWAVGDEIVVAPASNSATNYAEVETRFIKTIVSANTFTLSATVGGVEAALTYSHVAGCKVGNLTKNIVINTTNVSYQWYGYFTCVQSGDNDIQYVHFESVGGTAANKTALTIAGANYVGFAGINNCLFSRLVTYGLYFVLTNSADTTTGNLFYHRTSVTTNQYTLFINAANNKTLNDYVFFSAARYPVCITNGAVETFNRCYISGAGQFAATSGAYLSGVLVSEFNDCEFSANRQIGFYYVGNCVEVNLNRCAFGAHGLNGTSDLYMNPDIYVTSVLKSCTFTAAVLVVGTGTMLPGSKLVFDTFQNVSGTNLWYTNGGSFLSELTTVHTAGGVSLKNVSSGTTNFNTWLFKVPTGNILGKTMTIAVWCYIGNAAYWAGTHTQPYLSVNYDNGTVAVAYAAELAGAWMLLPITFTPTTSFGQVTVTLASRTDASAANAPVYFDDFAILYPAGYQLNLGTLDLWADGQPVTPPISTNASAQDIWTALQTVSYGTNTMGELVKRIAQLSDDNQALIIGM